MNRYAIKDLDTGLVSLTTYLKRVEAKRDLEKNVSEENRKGFKIIKVDVIEKK